MLAQVVLMTLAQAEVPSALEDWEVPGFEVLNDAPQVFLVSRSQKRDCPKLGSVCVSPGGSATVVGVEVSDERPAVTVLARARVAWASRCPISPGRWRWWPGSKLALSRGR